MPRSVVVLLLLCLLACGEPDIKQMFASHGGLAVPGEVRNLQGGKVACLHCPMYFAFDATSATVSGIIAEHQMKQVESLPRLAAKVEDLVMGEASWWQRAAPSEADKVYWVSYSTTGPGLEPAFRLLVLKGDRAFFITSGHFAKEYYVRDDA